MLSLGPYELHAIAAGRFALDGGAMFGVVPKVLWEQAAVPDELNRIPLVMRCLLAIDRRAGRVVLVDSGPGHKWSDEEIERFKFAIDDDPLGRGLRASGVSDEDVTDVIVTHLHFDHNGGLTEWEDPREKQPVPRFSKARHWIHEQHLVHALSPTPKDRGSFYKRDYEAIQQAGLFELVSGDSTQTPFPEVEWFIAHGHTPYQLLPRFCSPDLSVQFCADLIPTMAHLALPWVMAYDNQPLVTIQEKQTILTACAESDLALFSEHDPDVALARIDTTGKRPRIREFLAL